MLEQIEFIRLRMVRPDLNNLPSYELPKGYSLRYYQSGDGPIWAKIEAAAGEFDNPEAALDRFKKEFGAYESDLEQRCLFLQHGEKVIGTTTAWYNEHGLDAKYHGRLHWVAIHPDYQGNKLAKPLVAEAMHRMRELGHEEAYLTSQTTSYKAINMYYVHFGFIPIIHETKSLQRAWKLLSEKLDIPDLATLR